TSSHEPRQRGLAVLPASFQRAGLVLLVSHGGGELFFGVDEVVVVIAPELDPGPGDGSAEYPAVGVVALVDGHAGVHPEVAAFVEGEVQRMRPRHAARADR